MTIHKQLKSAASQVEETTRHINMWRIKRMHAEALAAKAALERSLASRPPLRRTEPGERREERSAAKPASTAV